MSNNNNNNNNNNSTAESGAELENVNVVSSALQPNNHIIRQLEVEAYSALISALFAQGELTWRKDQLLQEIRWALKIPDDVHKRELVRVHADSSLQKLHNLIPTIPNELYSITNNLNSTDKNKPPPRKKRKVTYSPSRNTYDELEPEKTAKRNANQRKSTSKSKDDTPKPKRKDDHTLRDESEEELKAKKARIEQEKEEILRRLASLDQVEESDEEMNEGSVTGQMIDVPSDHSLTINPYPITDDNTATTTTTTTTIINNKDNTSIDQSINNNDNMIINFTNTETNHHHHLTPPISTSTSSNNNNIITTNVISTQPTAQSTFTFSSTEKINDL